MMRMTDFKNSRTTTVDTFQPTVELPITTISQSFNDIDDIGGNHSNHNVIHKVPSITDECVVDKIMPTTIITKANIEICTTDDSDSNSKSHNNDNHNNHNNTTKDKRLTEENQQGLWWSLPAAMLASQETTRIPCESSTTNNEQIKTDTALPSTSLLDPLDDVEMFRYFSSVALQIGFKALQSEILSSCKMRLPKTQNTVREHCIESSKNDFKSNSTDIITSVSSSKGRNDSCDDVQKPYVTHEQNFKTRRTPTTRSRMNENEDENKQNYDILQPCTKRLKHNPPDEAVPIDVKACTGTCQSELKDDRKSYSSSSLLTSSSSLLSLSSSSLSSSSEQLKSSLSLSQKQQQQQYPSPSSIPLGSSEGTIVQSIEQMKQKSSHPKDSRTALEASQQMRQHVSQMKQLSEILMTLQETTEKFTQSLRQLRNQK